MLNISRKLSAVALAASLAYTTAPAMVFAGPVYCTNCATRFGQASELARAVETAVNTGQQLQTQIRQYEDMIRQGLSLADTALDPIADSMRQLSDLYETGVSMAGQMSDFTSEFSDKYKDFDTFLQEAGGDPERLQSYYGEWANQTSASARTAMQSAGMNVNQIDGETATLSDLVNQSQNSDGRLQAVQAGNQISAMLVQQMQKMRVMVNDQIQAQGVYQAQTAAEAAAKKAADDTAMGGEFANSGSQAF